MNYARRREIADLTLKGLTQLEIAAKLGCSQSLVSGALIELRENWKELWSADYNAKLSVLWAQLDHLIREAWARDDLDLVRKVLMVKCRVLGISTPKRLELSGTLGGQIPWQQIASSALENESDDPIARRLEQYESGGNGESHQPGRN